MQLSHIVLKKYKGKWVALDDSYRKVISSGTSAKIALSKAKKAGHLEPILFKVPVAPEAGYVGTQV